jgi:hypothetical protein
LCARIRPITRAPVPALLSQVYRRPGPSWPAPGRGEVTTARSSGKRAILAHLSGVGIGDAMNRRSRSNIIGHAPLPLIPVDRHFSACVLSYTSEGLGERDLVARSHRPNPTQEDCHILGVSFQPRTTPSPQKAWRPARPDRALPFIARLLRGVAFQPCALQTCNCRDRTHDGAPRCDAPRVERIRITGAGRMSVEGEFAIAWA